MMDIKDWRDLSRQLAGAGLGAYSAIVYKEGDYVVAETNDGRKIAEGEAGVDDAEVIQSAVDALTNGGKIFLNAGTYILERGITIYQKDNVVVEGQGYITHLKLKDNFTQEEINSSEHPNVMFHVRMSNNVVIKI